MDKTINETNNFNRRHLQIQAILSLLSANKNSSEPATIEDEEITYSLLQDLGDDNLASMEVISKQARN